MSNEDYREKVEEHRQEIDLQNGETAKVSRVKRHRKPGTKKQKNPIMTALVVIFILFPLSILGYVWLFYEPEAKAPDKDVVKDDTNQVVILKNDPEKTPNVDLDETNENDEAKKQEEADLTKVEQEKQRLEAEEAKKAEQKKSADDKAAAQKEKAQEEKKKAEEQANAQRKTHTVSSTDNLYQIAIKYYGSGSPANIEKIKQANNLSSDSISAGQVLVIAP
ncbi:Elastin-binding protein ebpS [Solibacillus sp. R5-41]|uniref:LysM peptidoglycan-binding domain-containing protein n=1 Tax=Solibacillus sp. R5-41 TaxID=2048654 RepID=UPI000C128BD7|nr:LysM peptidoglycan-binding domain-containing protein [Solibacillus sp. R5-41]ATP39603.1 Elastin-binding protein ebpS [Solibacillus sp. R5-41]